MLNFITKEDVIDGINTMIIDKLNTGTRRNGNSISLRPIIYNCIREVYYEIMDTDKLIPEDLSDRRSFFWSAPLGSTIHEILQEASGLDKFEYTEKLYTFKSFSPLQVRTKCDGIDTRDPNAYILYEIKTKSKIPSSPYQEELLQNLLSCFFFRREMSLPIKGSSMVYVDRNDPFNIVFFNYDFFDKESPIYLNVQELLNPIFYKIKEIVDAITTNTPPSMNSKFIKKFAFNRNRCNECLYRDVCKKDIN